MTVHRLGVVHPADDGTAVQPKPPAGLPKTYQKGWQLSKALDHGYGHRWEFCPQKKNATICRFDLSNWYRKWVCVWDGGDRAFLDTKNMQT